MNNKELQKRNWLQIIFLSSDEPRLRAGWRLAIHTLLFLLITSVAGTVLFIPIFFMKIGFDSPLALAANEISMLIGIASSTWLARRFLDKRSFVSLGFKIDRLAAKDLLIGIFIPFFQIGLVFAIEIGMGWTKFNGFAWQADTAPTLLAGLGLWLAIFMIGGWQEELLSRGYHLQNLENGLNLSWAVLISSSVFGFLHIFNNGSSWISTLGIILAGLFLALPFILTRQLWLSIGVHIGWNFFEGVVFGFPVSGLDTYHLLRHTVNGPELWTGGIFGPEAGLLVIPALLVGTVLILIYARSDFRKKNLG